MVSPRGERALLRETLARSRQLTAGSATGGPGLFGALRNYRPFDSLRGYRKGWLAYDIAAAAALVVIAVPEQIATSRLAGMPPVTGLYAFVAGSALFALLGSSPLVSVGADSTIAPLMAVGVARLSSAGAGAPGYVAFMSLVAVVVGVMVAAVGILRMGFIAELLSVPIITGFLAGVAVIIVVHQLPDALGLPVSGGSTLRRATDALRHVNHANIATVVVAGAVLAIVVVSEHVDRRIPGALVALVASVGVSAATGLRSHGVAVLGTVAHGAPIFGLHNVTWTDLGRAIPLAGVVALVVVSQSAATANAFAARGGSGDGGSGSGSGGSGGGIGPDVNRDFVGVGAGSVLAGLTGAFAVDASPPRTALVQSVGGRTQVASLLACAVVAGLVPAAGLLKDLPLATLGAILIFVATRIFRVRDLAAIARFDPVELVLATVTLAIVAFVGVEQGIAVAVGLSILDRLRRSAEPKAHVLGRVPGTTSWEPLSPEGGASATGVPESDQRRPQPVPGVLVVLFAAPLYFANAKHFRDEIDEATAKAGPNMECFVLDVAGMHDIDFTGSRVLAELVERLDRRGVSIALARAGSHLERNLDRAGITARIGSGRFFGSVDEAVEALDRSK